MESDASTQSTVMDTGSDHERIRALIEADVCTLCESGFVIVKEETTYEPRSWVYACEDHREHGDGTCPGTIIRLYDDGHVTRRVYGRGTVPMS